MYCNAANTSEFILPDLYKKIKMKKKLFLNFGNFAIVRLVSTTCYHKGQQLATQSAKKKISKKAKDINLN